MTTEPPILIALPDGRSFNAPSVEVLVQWANEQRIPTDATLTIPGSPPIVASKHPALHGIKLADAWGAAKEPDSAVSTVIPYKNAPALIGYYTAVASLIPCLAFLAGPTAIVLGIVGLQKVRTTPECKGTAHAIVAIVLGSLTTLANAGAVVFMFVMANSK